MIFYNAKIQIYTSYDWHSVFICAYASFICASLWNSSIDASLCTKWYWATSSNNNYNIQHICCVCVAHWIHFIIKTAAFWSVASCAACQCFYVYICIPLRLKCCCCYILSEIESNFIYKFKLKRWRFSSLTTTTCAGLLMCILVNWNMMWWHMYGKVDLGIFMVI